MKKSAMLLSILMLTLIFYGCRKKEDVIKIGVAGPMTGDQAKMGTDFKNGVTLAVEEWNAKGGVLGKKIAIMIEDDQHELQAGSFYCKQDCECRRSWNNRPF